MLWKAVNRLQTTIRCHSLVEMIRQHPRVGVRSSLRSPVGFHRTLTLVPSSFMLKGDKRDRKSEKACWLDPDNPEHPLPCGPPEAYPLRDVRGHQGPCTVPDGQVWWAG